MAPPDELTRDRPGPAALADSAFRILAIVLTIAVVALHVYAVWSLGSFWRDEVITLNLASVPLADAIQLHRYDGYPPLYALLLRAWTAFGHLTAPGWLRSFGLAVGLVTVVSLWQTSRWTGSRYPVIGLLIVGANPAMIRFGDMLRPAGLGVAFAVLAFGAFWKLVRDGTRRDTARAAVVAVLLVNTVYQSALLVLALGVAGIILSIHNRRRRTAAKVLAASAIAALSMLPWANYIRAQSILLSTGTDDAPAAMILRAAVSAFAPLCFLAPVIILALALWRRHYRPESIPQHEAGLEAYAGLSAVLVLLLIGGFVVNLEYFPSIWYVFPIVTVGALALDAFLRPSVYVWARSGVVAASLLWLPGLPSWNDFPKRLSNVREIAAVIEDQGAVGDLVLMAPPAVGIAFNYYYHGPASWSTAPPIAEMRVYRPDLVLAAADTDPLTPELRERARRAIEESGTLWWIGFNLLPLDVILPDPPPACTVDIDPVRTPVDGLERLYLRSWSVANCGRTFKRPD